MLAERARLGSYHWVKTGTLEMTEQFIISYHKTIYEALKNSPYRLGLYQLHMVDEHGCRLLRIVENWPEFTTISSTIDLFAFAREEEQKTGKKINVYPDPREER